MFWEGLFQLFLEDYDVSYFELSLCVTIMTVTVNDVKEDRKDQHIAV